eukprot:Sspe_Gene.109082::Locus_88474_Transcript_2_2_Confidence_0.750_Length_1043::g.109082::m.109082
MSDEVWRVARVVQAEQSPPPLAEHTAVSCEREGRKVVVVFGGWAGMQASFSNKVWEYDVVPKKWAELAPSGGDGPCPRYAHGAAMVNGDMVVYGGYDGKGVLGDTWKLDLGAMAWSRVEVAGDSPAPRRGAVMVSTGGGAFMFGGMDGQQRLDELWELSVDSEGMWKWESIQQSAPWPSARDAASLTYHNGTLTLFGGYSSHHSNDLYTWTREGGWVKVHLTSSPPPRSHHTMAYVVPPEKPPFYVVGLGFGADGERSDLLEITGGNWEVRTPSGDPVPRRACHTSCLVGCMLVVFGGWDGASYSNKVVEVEFDRPADVPGGKKK